MYEMKTVPEYSFTQEQRSLARALRSENLLSEPTRRLKYGKKQDLEEMALLLTGINHVAPMALLREIILDRATQINEVSQVEAQEINAAVRHNRFPDYLRNQRDAAKAEVDKWTEKFREDPAYRLERADVVMAYAAKHELYARLVTWLEGDKAFVIEEVEAELTRRVLDMAGRTESSSSQSSNMMTRARLAAMAEFLERRRWDY